MKPLYKFKIMNHGNEDFDEKYFSMFFKKYDAYEFLFYCRWFAGWIKLLEQFIPIKEGYGRQVLEVGCGIGAFAKHLRERGFEVTATDISHFIIKQAKKHQKDINFRVDNIEKEFKINKKFDYIFALEVLEHLKNPKRALANIRKVLINNGILVFSTPIPTKKTLADPMHVNLHEPEYWLKLGKELGFKQIFYTHATFIPYFYRFHSFFSYGFPIRITLPFLNTTCFIFFKK